MPSANWLRTGIDIPHGGESYEVVYRTGSKSSVNHLTELGPILTSVLGCQLFEGSLNLWAESPVVFDAPAKHRAANSTWLLAPVVIGEAAVGVAARKSPAEGTRFIEVFACDQIAPQLGLTPGDVVSLRIFSGEHLGLESRELGTT